MKAKSEIIYDAMMTDAFHAWFCGEFTEHSIKGKRERNQEREKIDAAITRFFRPLFVQTAEEQEQPAPATKPAAEAKPKPAAKKKKKSESRVNVVITGAPEPVVIANPEEKKAPKPESFEAKPSGEVSALDSVN